MSLIVGYTEREDSDGVRRTFFKIKSSYGWGWGQVGYGCMSSEYLKAFGIAGYLLTNRSADDF